MPDRRDRAEALAVDRRRREAALLRGVHDEDDPAPSTVRALLGGAVVALLLLAGAAVVGVLGAAGDGDRSSAPGQRPLGFSRTRIVVVRPFSSPCRSSSKSPIAEIRSTSLG